MKTVATKKNGDEVRVLEQEYRGVKSIHVRTFYTDKVTGEMKPTQKGVNFSRDNLPALIEALQTV
jgi:hypothetical protein